MIGRLMDKKKSVAPIFLNSDCYDNVGSRRFADRTKRLARRQESDVFREYLMPLAWIMALAGFVGLFGLWLVEGTAEMASSPALPVFAVFSGTPALTALLRAVRGHFHSAVRDL